MKPCFFSFLSRPEVTVDVAGHGLVTLRGGGLANGIQVFGPSGELLNSHTTLWAIQSEAEIKVLLDELASEGGVLRFGIDRVLMFSARSWWGEDQVTSETIERARGLVNRYDYRTLSGSDPEAFLVMAAYVCSKCREDWRYLRDSLLRKPTQRVFLHEAMVWFYRRDQLGIERSPDDGQEVRRIAC